MAKIKTSKPVIFSVQKQSQLFDKVKKKAEELYRKNGYQGVPGKIEKAYIGKGESILF